MDPYVLKQRAMVAWHELDRLIFDRPEVTAGPKRPRWARSGLFRQASFGPFGWLCGSNRRSAPNLLIRRDITRAIRRRSYIMSHILMRKAADRDGPW